MATSPAATPTPITPPRVPLIDPRTGLIDRAWYMFFLSLFQTAQTVDGTQLGPSAESLIASYDEALRALAQATGTQPPQNNCCDSIDAIRQEVQTEPASGVAELAQEVSSLRQEVQTLPKPPLGTMAPLQQDNLPWVRFDTTPQSVPETVTGTLYWDDADRSKTLAVVMEDTGQIVQDIGEETFYRVKATSAITKGQVLMFTGTVGASGGILAAPATGLTVAQSEYILGVATQNIALNSWGYATWFGEIKGVNTTGGAESWVDGQILYYNPAVAGGLTKNVPTAPNVKAIVAAVVHAATNGILFVRPTFGSSLGDNSNNVEISSLAGNDILVYDSVDARWENKAPTAARDALGLGTGNPSNGQMLIGNGTDFTTAALTAGTGIAVTNGAGSSTIATNLAAGANISITGTTTQTIEVTGLGTMAFEGIGVSGTFTTADVPPLTVTVTNGIISNIV